MVHLDNMTDLADLAGSLRGGEPGNRNRAGMRKTPQPGHGRRETGMRGMREASGRGRRETEPEPNREETAEKRVKTSAAGRRTGRRGDLGNEVARVGDGGEPWFVLSELVEQQVR